MDFHFDKSFVVMTFVTGVLTINNYNVVETGGVIDFTLIASRSSTTMCLRRDKCNHMYLTDSISFTRTTDKKSSRWYIQVDNGTDRIVTLGTKVYKILKVR